MLLAKCRERILAELPLLVSLWKLPLEVGGEELPQQEWRRLLSDQCGTLHLKAIVRKKMKLFQEASHL